MEKNEPSDDFKFYWADKWICLSVFFCRKKKRMRWVSKIEPDKLVIH